MSAPGRALARKLAASILASGGGLNYEGLYHCGHPRTPDNTKPHGTRPGGRCRTCQRVYERESQRKRRARLDNPAQ